MYAGRSTVSSSTSTCSATFATLPLLDTFDRCVFGLQSTWEGHNGWVSYDEDHCLKADFTDRAMKLEFRRTGPNTYKLYSNRLGKYIGFKGQVGGDRTSQWGLVHACSGNSDAMEVRLHHASDGNIKMECVSQGLPYDNAYRWVGFRWAGRILMVKYKEDEGMPLKLWPATTTKQSSIEHRLTRSGAGRSQQSGSLAVSMSWDNTDDRHSDLDLWVTCPSGEKIYYMNKSSRCGGKLDVDRREQAHDPVENVVWTSGAPAGKYKIEVNNYSSRGGATEIPCEVMIVNDGGRPQKFHVRVPGRSGQTAHVTTITR